MGAFGARIFAVDLASTALDRSGWRFADPSSGVDASSLWIAWWGQDHRWLSQANTGNKLVLRAIMLAA